MDQGTWRDHETHRDSWFAMKHFAQLWCSWMGSRRLIFIVISLSRRVLNLLLPRRPPRCSSWLEASRTNRNRHTVKQELTVKMKGGVGYSGWATLVHYRQLSGEESIYMTVWGASWTERGVWQFISNRLWSKLICNYRRHHKVVARLCQVLICFLQRLEGGQPKAGRIYDSSAHLETETG